MADLRPLSVPAEAVVATALLVAVDLALVLAAPHLARFPLYVGLANLGWLIYLLRRHHHFSSVPIGLLLAVALVAQLPGLLSHPLTSDDAYRYVWDGRVQLSGVDPYRYIPTDPALAGLHDPLLFPPGQLTVIGWPDVPTIYPPVAELWFTGIAALTPWTWGTLGVQVGALLAVLVTTGLLARWLGERRGLALAYGASPAVLLAATNEAHVDALAALAVLGLAWLAARRRHWLAGVCLGLAGGIKLVPLLLVPVFLRRSRWRTAVAGVGLVAVSYVPHLLAVGGLVVGFLPGYLAEEGYGGTRRFALLIWLPVELRTPVALLLALALAAWAVRRARTEPVLITACWLYGAAFLIATPVYSWYALPFVVLVLMAGRWEWLAVWVAAGLAYAFYDHVGVHTAAYGLALVTVVLVALRRRRTASGLPFPDAVRTARGPARPGGREPAGLGDR